VASPASNFWFNASRLGRVNEELGQTKVFSTTVLLLVLTGWRLSGKLPGTPLIKHNSDNFSGVLRNRIVVRDFVRTTGKT